MSLPRIRSIEDPGATSAQWGRAHLRTRVRVGLTLQSQLVCARYWAQAVFTSVSGSLSRRAFQLSRRSPFPRDDATTDGLLKPQRGVLIPLNVICRSGAARRFTSHRAAPDRQHGRIPNTMLFVGSVDMGGGSSIRSWWASASKTTIGDLAATAFVGLALFAAAGVLAIALGFLFSLVR